MSYHCPKCGTEISFGEAICPNCNEDVTSLWERVNVNHKEKPKVLPGMGGMEQKENVAPFPSPNGAMNNVFPPQNANPFPTAENKNLSPFPPSDKNLASPFPSPAKKDASPFPPVAPSALNEPTPSPASPFPPVEESKPFPPVEQSAEIQTAYLDIPRIGGQLPISKIPFRVGRNEIKAVATKDLPDLNAYKNISRKRTDSEHFIIHEKDGMFTIEDIHSTNGTYLGTTKLGPGVPPQALRPGDKIIVPIEEFGRMVQLEIIFKLP